MTTIDKIVVVCAALAAILTTVAQYMIFFVAPVELTMGIVQKIFYSHVPSAMMMYAGFSITSIASIFYLLKPARGWDQAAIVGVEIGLFFAAYVMISGPLWGSKAWGKPWEWDPQLTATLILCLMYGAYALLRLFGGTSKRVRKIAAVLAILSAVSIPIVHYAVKLWGGIHPVVEREGGDGLASEIKTVFLVSMVAFFVLFVAMTAVHLRVSNRQAKLEDLYVDFEDYLRSRT